MESGSDPPRQSLTKPEEVEQLYGILLSAIAFLQLIPFDSIGLAQLNQWWTGELLC
ncbi:hypothetical protein BDV25DRAFT_165942 [Aspergillus avenaceus]|uniref:Uncharacterized protein n=1 Tax=Aspergillus avenaceus TaxID=36643 RepID=A0A5N6TFE0_ASPAV|nr:hypothetical protein BDV25DRAFT_165942 [Aspergillus avenaceus]